MCKHYNDFLFPVVSSNLDTNRHSAVPICRTVPSHRNTPHERKARRLLNAPKCFVPFCCGTKPISFSILGCNSKRTLPSNVPARIGGDSVQIAWAVLNSQGKDTRTFQGRCHKEEWRRVQEKEEEGGRKKGMNEERRKKEKCKKSARTRIGKSFVGGGRKKEVQKKMRYSKARQGLGRW